MAEVIEERRVIRWENGNETVVEQPKIGRPAYWNEINIIELGKSILEVTQANKEIMYITQAILAHGMSKDRYYELKRKFENVKMFHQLHREAQDICEARLVDNGLKGATNAAMTKFVLINKHDWKEKSEVTANVSHSLADMLSAAPLPESPVEGE